MDTILGGSSPGSTQSPTAIRGAARDILRLRKAAKNYFGKSVLSDPAWNLILALYSVDNPPRGCHVGTVAKRADIPHTTAIRWLGKLEREGLVSLTPDKVDKRAVRVELTAKANDAMQRSFGAARLLTK